MGLITMPCWECDKCGYIWLKVKGRNPVQCPNRKCRTRKWHIQKEAVARPQTTGYAAHDPDYAAPTYYIPAKYRKGKQ